MIMIAGHVHLDPADVSEFMADAQATYPVAAANPGNILLSFAVDNAERGTVTVLEEWKSTDALAAHLAAHQVQQIFAKWTARMRNEVRMFDAMNERDLGHTELLSTGAFRSWPGLAWPCAGS